MGQYQNPVRLEPVGLRALSDDPRDHVLLEFVVEPQPEPVRLPETPPPSARASQLWCTHPHVEGGPRRLHTHGYAPAWAPGLGKIDL